MRQALEELQKALKDLDLGRLRLSLEQAREAQRRFVDRLDQTLALLKRARLEAELAQLRKLAEALADRPVGADAEEFKVIGASPGVDVDSAADTDSLVHRGVEVRS